MCNDDDEYYCPNCDAILNEQIGFDPNLNVWTCEICGQELYGDDIESTMHRFSNIVWHCDCCGTVLNKQSGFTDSCESWRCTECGHKNRITEDEVYDSEEDYERDKVEYACPNCNCTLNDQPDFYNDAIYTCSDCGKKLYRGRSTYEKRIECERLKEIRLNWKQQAEKIESDYKTAAVKNAGAGAAGLGAGVAVVALGPTAAMGIATTFGVASTGTAISALSGAAATNAALAWLGGGALAAGGGGMAAGNAFLALAGPVGWAIAGVALIASGLVFWKSASDKKRIENVFTLISERDVKSYKLAIVELNERIARIEAETNVLREAISNVKDFGKDYMAMTEAQQYALGSYVNLMLSSTQFLVNPIMGLLPKFGEREFDKYMSWDNGKIDTSLCNEYKPLIISLCNLLYKIELDDKDKNLLFKTFRKNKKMLTALNIKKKEFSIEIMDAVEEALSHNYELQSLQAEL